MLVILEQMDDYIFMRKSLEMEKLALQLGFTKVYFLENDFMILKGKSQKELLKEIELARNRKLKTILKPDSEDLLRFALEKNGIDIVYGMENLHPKDSLHFVRSGLDQILCKIAAEREKVLVFSFSEILNSAEREKLLARIIFNIKLCKKYQVSFRLCSFASSESELRSAKDFQALGRVLGI